MIGSFKRIKLPLGATPTNVITEDSQDFGETFNGGDISARDKSAEGDDLRNYRDKVDEEDFGDLSPDPYAKANTQPNPGLSTESPKPKSNSQPNLDLKKPNKRNGASKKVPKTINFDDRHKYVGPRLQELRMRLSKETPGMCTSCSLENESQFELASIFFN